MSLLFRYDVVTQFDDDAPEPFGVVDLAARPVEGDVIQLKWLDGKDAHQAKVMRVGETTIYVRTVRGEKL